MEPTVKKKKAEPAWGVTLWSGAAWTAVLAIIGHTPLMLIFTALFASGGIYRIIKRHKKIGQA